MNRLQKVFSLIGVIIVAIVLVRVGIWYAKPTVEDIAEMANAVADTFQLRVDSLTGVVEERGRIAIGQAELVDSLNKRDKLWATQLEQAGARLLTFQNTIASLKTEFADRPEVDFDSVGVQVPINDERRFDDENYFRAWGNVSWRFGQARADVELNYAMQSSFTTVVSRLPDGQLRCDVKTGVPFLEVAQHSCVDNVEDPIQDMTRSNLPNFVFGSPALTVAAFILVFAGGAAVATAF